MSLRVAIVGCGKIADAHVEEIQKLPALARVVAVCDREKLLAEQIAVRYGIERFSDRFEEVLERDRPDVVHVTTPPESHLPIARTAVAAGCHLYVEKPLAPTAAETEDLVALVERAKKKLTVGWNSYFDPPALEARRHVASGALGEIVHVEGWYGYDLSSPFGQALLADPSHWVHRLPGKVAHNVLDHVVSKILEHVPDAAPEVSAFGSTFRRQRFGDTRDEMIDELRFVVRGARTTAYGTFTSHVRPVAQFVRLYGTKGICTADYAARSVTLEPATSLPSAIGRLVPAFRHAQSHLAAAARNVVRFAKNEFHYFAGLRHQLELFYRSIAEGTEPPIPAAEMVRVARVMEEIFRQTARAGRVEPERVVDAKAAGEGVS